jgi:mono/diheme cytochrome c family protein
MKRAFSLLVACLFVCLPGAGAEPDFARDVHPIFAARCFACHGGDKRSGGLSLQDYGDVLKGGRNGPAILPGKSAESLLIRRITATTSRMPASGPPLTAQEIAIIKDWIDAGARPTADGPTAKTPWTSKLELRKPDVPVAKPGTSQHPVDRFVASYLLKQGAAAPTLVSDRAFARRAYLDVWGLLPLPAQLAEFVDSKGPDKRERLIASLLGNAQNYTEHWISFWNDLLRNDEGVNYAGSRKSITPWLHDALLANMPYDRFVQKLLNPTAASDPSGFLLGVNWRGDVSASQLPMMQAAQNSAQVFLGVNLKCNSCHDSFISKWKLKDAYGLAAFFADADQLELVRCDNRTGQYTGAQFLYPELAATLAATGVLKTPADRKAAAARMFTETENGRMPRTIVNRIWARLFGRGLVEDVDDLDGEPWNPELLDWISADFVEHGYDLKHLLVTIMTSQAYQFPAIRRSGKPSATQVKNYVFRGPEVRRMTAEQFVDSLSELTGDWPVFAPGTQGIYSRQWRLPSTLLTRGLGRPIRDQVYTERDSDATTLQALELVNGEVLNTMVARGAKRMLGKMQPAPENLYDSGRVSGDTDTTTLARRMTAKERIVDIDISGVDELHLLTINAGSSSPERVFPVWINAVLIGANGETRLSSLNPNHGRVMKKEVTFGGGTRPDAIPTAFPAELIYDIKGKGYSRFRAITGFDDQSLHNDIGPAARFFVFKEKPDLERLVHVQPAMPIEPLSAPFTKERVISTVFEFMLGRQPSRQEQALAGKMLGADRVSAEGLADLLWAVAMQPEFQLVY